MYDIKLLGLGSKWKHLKRGTTYEIIGISECATNGDNEGQQVVVYRGLHNGELWHRNVHQFLDGRFMPISRSETSDGPISLTSHTNNPSNIRMDDRVCMKTLLCLKDEGHEGECSR